MVVRGFIDKWKGFTANNIRTAFLPDLSGYGGYLVIAR
jgi:hypothetical protein